MPPIIDSCSPEGGRKKEENESRSKHLTRGNIITFTYESGRGAVINEISRSSLLRGTRPRLSPKTLKYDFRADVRHLYSRV